MIGPNGEQIGVISTQEALKQAYENGLDLVEVAPQANPPVCRVMDYSKYKYEQNRREKEARKKQKIISLKEIKLKPKIEEHDYQVKLRAIQRFLDRGDKVKITMMFRGREMAHTDIGRKIMDRFAQDISGEGEVEKMPMIEFRNMVMVLKPR